MAGVIHGVATYANILYPEACTLTLSHGLTPGVAVLRCSPQPLPPASDGTLVVTDGVLGEIVLNNCHLDDLRVNRDESGQYWTLSIVDRRWKWRDLGNIQGQYNQLNPFGHLIPWTIRSPTELAAICLDAMGEVGYTILMPSGIPSQPPYVQTDIFNISGVNPPIVWDGIPPAQALQQLCDLFGVRIVYQWSTDSVLITPIGVGGPLPQGSIHTQSIALKNPETPDSIAVRGAPTRYQVRLNLFAVGRDWDGSYRPINYLSYAPRPITPGTVQESQVVLTNPVSGIQWFVTIGQTIVSVTSTGSLTSDLTAIAAQINASPALSGIVSASSTGTAVVITGAVIGSTFDVTVDVSSTGQQPPPTIEADLVQEAQQPAQANVGDWSNSPPPEFPNIRAVPGRLTYAQAKALAQETVWRCYQVWNIQTSGEGTDAQISTPIIVPGYSKNPIIRANQLILDDKQVDQVVPMPADPGLIGPDGRPIVVNLYSGYSLDKPAAVFGSVNVDPTLRNGIWYPGAVTVPGTTDGNTPEGSQILVPFTVDPEFVLIKFSQPVYKYLPAGKITAPAPLTLQTAVQVRDPVDNQVTHFWKLIPLPGNAVGTNPRVYQHDDVQVNVTSVYDDSNILQGFSILETDPLIRADYYLANHLKEYLLTGAQINAYNGIMPIDLDGAIQQVTWEVGEGGCSTTASLNTEHSLYIPPYPMRRRAEFLAPYKGEVYQQKDFPRPDMYLPKT